MKGNYKYVSTLKNEYTIWEYWSTRVNWYFYRELYSNYAPVRETNYSVIWEKSDQENVLTIKAQVSWKYINESTCYIEVELPDYTEPAYVDLKIKYNTIWTQDRLKEGGLQKILCVQDGGEQYNAYGANSCYYLSGKTEGCYIPVYVRNGKGYVYITSYPVSCTKLEGVDVAVNTILKQPDFSLHLTNYTDYCRMVSIDSVSQDGTILKFDNTEYATTILENASRLIANSEVGIVSNIWKDGSYIYVSLEKSINRDNFIYPNNIEVVKKEKSYTAENYSDEEWVCGVSRSEGKILLNEEINIEKLYAVKIGKITKKVISTELTEEGYCISLEDNNGIQIFTYPNEIQLIYSE